MDDGFGVGIFITLLFVFAVFVGTLIKTATYETQVDHAIICMEKSADANFCRVQAGLTISKP